MSGETQLEADGSVLLADDGVVAVDPSCCCCCTGEQPDCEVVAAGAATNPGWQETCDGFTGTWAWWRFYYGAPPGPAWCAWLWGSADQYVDLRKLNDGHMEVALFLGFTIYFYNEDCGGDLECVDGVWIGTVALISTGKACEPMTATLEFNP